MTTWASVSWRRIDKVARQGHRKELYGWMFTTLAKANRADLTEQDWLCTRWAVMSFYG